MDNNESTQRNGPMVLLLAVLAVLGVRTFTSDSAPPSPERIKLGVERALREGKDENGGATEAERSDVERFAQMFRDFREVRPISGLTDEPTRDLPSIEEIKDFMAKADLRCIIVCVPDPMDSGSGDRFDTLIDAIQRAAETQEYVLDRFYYPWQKVKEPSKGLRVGPLGAASRETQQTNKAQASLSRLLQSQSEERPWKRLPGMLLFHTPPDSHPRSEYHRELLLVFLVGERATAGLHKDAFMTSLELIKLSKEYKLGSKDKPESQNNKREPGQVDVLGPCFSGAQVSLEKIIEVWAETEQKTGNSSLTTHFNLISGNATAILKNRLESICNGEKKVKVTFKATVVPENAVIDALFDYLDHPRNVAMLCESNTDYGHKMKGKWPEGNGPALFPFPLHVAAVRAAYEKTTGATKDNTWRLPSFGSKLQLRLKGGDTNRETEPSLTPEMTAATTERTLADMLGTIARERFRYVFITATDIKDELFLATLVREYCPESRLVFTDTDLLLGHPDFSANLRGSLVGSTYPMHFRNQNWSYPYQGERIRFTFPGPREQGSYNAMIALLNPKDCHRFLLEYGLPFQNTGRGPLFPPVWISVIGEGGIYPLKAEQRIDSEFPDYVFQATGPDESSNAPVMEAKFKPLYPALWIVPVLGISLLLFCLGWTYETGVKKSLFYPREHCQGQQRFYVFICLTSVFLVYWYLTFVWLIPVVRWLRQNGNSPVRMSWWNLIAPFFLMIVLPLALLGRARKRSRRIWLLCIFLFAGLINYLAYNGCLPGALGPGEALLFFERATNLANGVTPVVPIIMLGLAFFGWACVQLKRLYLLDVHDVDNPFFSNQSLLRFEEINKYHKEIDDRLRIPWQGANKYVVAITALVLLFVCCRLYVHFVPTVEGTVHNLVLYLALIILAVLIVCGWVHLRKIWENTQKLLHAITLLPLEKAFAHIPSAVTSMFGPNLTSERPGRRGHLNYQRVQHNLLTQEYPAIARDLPADALPPTLAKEMEKVMTPCTDDPNDPDKASCHLIKTARLCLQMLGNIWKDPGLRERLLGQVSDEVSDKLSALSNSSVVIQKTVQTGGAITKIDETIKPRETDKTVQNWLARVQDFVALEVTFYLSQFFVQLRNLALFLSFAPFLFLLAVTSYPFQPQRLWVLLAVLLIGLVTLSVIWIVIQIERNELVSRILKTTPNQISFRWGFISHLFLYAIPLLGILGAMSSDMSDLMHSWMDPLLQLLK